MESMAQEWIEEGKAIGKKEGIDIGKKEGIDIGKKEGKLEAQRQTLLHLLQWRFAPSEEERTRYAAHLEQIQNLDHLLQLVDQLLIATTLAEFAQKLHAFLPTATPQP